NAPGSDQLTTEAFDRAATSPMAAPPQNNVFLGGGQREEPVVAPGVSGAFDRALTPPMAAQAPNRALAGGGQPQEGVAPPRAAAGAPQNANGAAPAAAGGRGPGRIVPSNLGKWEGALLSLALHLEPGPGSRLTKFQYSGAPEPGAGPALVVDYQNRYDL